MLRIRVDIATAHHSILSDLLGRLVVWRLTPNKTKQKSGPCPLATTNTQDPGFFCQVSMIKRGNSRQICVLSEDSAWQNSTGSNHNKLSELLCHEFKPKLHSNAGVAVQTKDLPYNSKGSGTLVLADLNIASRSSWPRSRLWPCLVFIHVRFCKEIRIRKDHVRFWDFLFAFSGLFLPTVGQIGRCIPWKLDTFTCSG